VTLTLEHGIRNFVQVLSFTLAWSWLFLSIHVSFRAICLPIMSWCLHCIAYANSCDPLLETCVGSFNDRGMIYFVISTILAGRRCISHRAPVIFFEQRVQAPRNCYPTFQRIVWCLFLRNVHRKFSLHVLFPLLVTFCCLPSIYRA